MNIIHFGFRRELSCILLVFVICLLITSVNCDNYPIDDSFIKGANNHETSPSIETINSEGIIILEPIYPGGVGYSCRCTYDPSQTLPTPCLQEYGDPTYIINSPGSYILGKDEINNGTYIQIKAPNVHFDGNGETNIEYVDIVVDSSNSTITNIYNCKKIQSFGINTTISESNCGDIFCEGQNSVIKDNALSRIKTTGNHSTILRNRLQSGYHDAIQTYGSETIIIQNYISNYYNRGIVSYGDNSLIINNDVSRCVYYGILTSGSNTLVQNNSISNNHYYWGILAIGADNIIFNNRVNNSTYGGISAEGINAKIQNNTLHFNSEGILSNGSNHIISDNLVNDRYSDVSSRIYSEDSKNNWSIANKSSQNVTNDDFFWYYGIGILGSNSTLKNNKISNFNQEIWIKGQNNTIYNNYISNDWDLGWYGGAIDDGANNIWTNPTGPLPGSNIMGGPYIAGNYWSLPKGKGWSDLQPPNPKGYTTTPYEVSLDVYDTAPLVKVNTSSHIIEPKQRDFDH